MHSAVSVLNQAPYTLSPKSSALSPLDVKRRLADDGGLQEQARDSFILPCGIGGYGGLSIGKSAKTMS